uniref:Uncharacterized protein n=1 Tax=Sus scrofa TaxID=9823 RepID=A0A8D1C1N1_PIG
SLQVVNLFRQLFSADHCFLLPNLGIHIPRKGVDLVPGPTHVLNRSPGRTVTFEGWTSVSILLGTYQRSPSLAPPLLVISPLVPLYLFSLPLPSQQSLSKPAFFRQNSERRNFKLLDTRKLSRDGTGSPSRVSPPSTPSSPDDTFFNLGDPQNGRKKRKIPKRADHWALFCLLCHRPGRHGGASRLG